MNPNSDRKFLLITLSHAERQNLYREEMVKRILQLSNVFQRSLIRRAKDTFTSESKVTLLQNTPLERKSGRAFPEFEGTECSAQAKKAWGSIVTYLKKKDCEPFVLGEENFENRLNMAESGKKALYTLKRRCNDFGH